MKFRILLFILYRRMIRAAKQNTRFKNFIQNKQLKFTIKSGQNNKGRQYVFDNGRISSSAQRIDTCDAAMIWRDAETAFKVMASGNDEAPMAALTEKKLQVKGDFKEFMWFSRALEIMMGKA